MRRFLACCEEIEQTVAEVYRHWQHVYRDDQELSELWERLADEELAHVSQIKLARRLPADGVFGGQKGEVEEVEKLLATARKLLADVKKITLSKEKALRTAIKMEEAFNRAHIANVGGFIDPSMQALFTSLARDDAQHVAALHNYCARVFGNS